MFSLSDLEGPGLGYDNCTKSTVHTFEPTICLPNV